MALPLATCATVIRPNLGPNMVARQAYDTVATLPNAFALRTSMRDHYLDKIESQVAWERGVGVGLISAAMIVTDLAMRGVGSPEILGLGLASAALCMGSSSALSTLRFVILTYRQASDADSAAVIEACRSRRRISEGPRPGGGQVSSSRAW